MTMEGLMGVGVIVIMVLVPIIYKKNKNSDNGGSNIRYQISRD